MMLPFAQASPDTLLTGGQLTAIITAVAGLMAAIFGGVKWLGKENTKQLPTADFSTLTKAYDEIVDNLREEVTRVVADNKLLRQDNANLHARITALEKSVVDKKELDKIREENLKLKNRVVELEREAARVAALEAEAARVAELEAEVKRLKEQYNGS